MLGDAASIASLVGVVVSLLGLGFAIWQLARLRGETRASREASEATRRAVARELTISDLGRTFEHVEAVKQALREQQWSRSLSYFPMIRRALVSIKYKDPHLSEYQENRLQAAVEFLEQVEHTIDMSRDNLSIEAIHEFIQGLIELQTTVAEIESKLFQSY